MLGICFTVSSCSDSIIFEPETEASLNAKLEQAYQDNSHKELHAIFAKWKKTIQPNTHDEIYNQSKIISHVYEIFKEIYDPFNEEYFSNYYKDRVDFIIVPNKIGYKLEETEDISYIEDFRPPVSFSEAQTLYITDEYLAAINNFIGESNSRVDCS